MAGGIAELFRVPLLLICLHKYKSQTWPINRLALSIWMRDRHAPKFIMVAFQKPLCLPETTHMANHTSLTPSPTLRRWGEFYPPYLSSILWTQGRQQIYVYRLCWRQIEVGSADQIMHMLRFSFSGWVPWSNFFNQKILSESWKGNN